MAKSVEARVIKAFWLDVLDELNALGPATATELIEMFPSHSPNAIREALLGLERLRLVERRHLSRRLHEYKAEGERCSCCDGKGWTMRFETVN